MTPSSPPDSVVVRGGCRLDGRVRTPGDKSISHRALLIGALAEGTSTIVGSSDGDDVARTAAAVEALGATVAREPGSLSVVGGRGRLGAAPPIDCANSGTSMRLLAGLCASLPVATTLFGDESLSKRPMDRVARPLSAMGAVIEGRGATLRPPIVVRGGSLRGIEWTPPMASAQVKSAILFAGLAADGETVVREAVPTRAHTEEMLRAAGAEITVEPWGTGRCVRVRRSALQPIDMEVPADPSQAAFWIVGACVVPESRVTVEHVYCGPERIGYVGVLRRMGASIDVRPDGDTAEISATAGPLTGTDIEAAEIPSLDEVPVLAVAAAAASGTTTFRDVAELTVKESDRLAATIALVESMGARASVRGDTLIVEGAEGIGPGPIRFHSGGDHRLAMAGLIGALACPSGGTVGGVAAVATSYPGFLADLGALAGADAWGAAAGGPAPRS